jgi:hypothetical protein
MLTNGAAASRKASRQRMAMWKSAFTQRG